MDIRRAVPRPRLRHGQCTRSGVHGSPARTGKRVLFDSVKVSGSRVSALDVLQCEKHHLVDPVGAHDLKLFLQILQVLINQSQSQGIDTISGEAAHFVRLLIVEHPNPPNVLDCIIIAVVSISDQAFQLANMQLCVAILLVDVEGLHDIVEIHIIRAIGHAVFVALTSMGCSAATLYTPQPRERDPPHDAATRASAGSEPKLGPQEPPGKKIHSIR